MVSTTVSGLDLDETDLQIIGQLQEDGRRSNSAIGRELGLPESTVRRRIERLLRNDFLKIAAIASSERLGRPVHVIMGLSLDFARNATATRALADLVQVGWLAATTGPYDILLEASFPSMDHLHEFITEEVAQIEGVERVETAIVLNLAKHCYDCRQLVQTSHSTEVPTRISVESRTKDTGNVRGTRSRSG